MVYAMQCIETGVIKIGSTTDVERRRKQLEQNYGQTLAVLSVFPGGVKEERQWQQRFSHLRIGRTEQFHPARDLMEALGRPLLVSANPDAVERMEITYAIMVFPMSEKYAAWLKRLASFCRRSRQNLLDYALVEYAKSVGFTKPAPLRWVNTKGRRRGPARGRIVIK